MSFNICSLCTQPSLSQLDTVSADIRYEGLNFNIGASDDVFFLPSQEPDVHRFRFALHVDGSSVLEMKLRVCVTWPTQIPENWNIYGLCDGDYYLQIGVGQRVAQSEKLEFITLSYQ